jgi:predicted phosphodiesterase
MCVCIVLREQEELFNQGITHFWAVLFLLHKKPNPMKKQTLQSQRIDQIVKDNINLSAKELGALVFKETGEQLSEGGIRTRKARVRGVPVSDSPQGSSIKETTIEEDLQIKKLKEHKTQNDKKYKMLLDENEKLQELLNIKEEILPYARVKLVADHQIKRKQATAFVLASDWHVEQAIDRSQINEDNEYSLEIAEKRAKQFFKATLILLREAEQNVHIKDLVLWLGGDFITGNIHTENLRICKLGPPKAISFARDLLINGIEFLLENTDCMITIPYNHGNHARITDKVWKAGEEDNSLEYLLYDQIAFHFKDNKRIKMVSPRGAITTLEVYGLKIAFVHGHHGFRYTDGVGGLYIPARKYIMRKFPDYYLVCMGHYHQYLQDTKFICNGSMIGYDQYADSMGFSFEYPKQTFFLIEEHRKCRTVTRPILFDL